jgi:rhodanese-related sulfurtransferase
MWPIFADQWQIGHSPDRQSAGHAASTGTSLTATAGGACLAFGEGRRRDERPAAKTDTGGTMGATRGGPGRSGTVTAVGAATPEIARAHFARLLELETDCADVAADLAAGTTDFVLLDVRSPSAFAAGHVDGARNLPHREISAAAVADLPEGTTLVVYCAGPHCNGADRAALALADLARPVKKMLGGMSGWREEGLPVVAGGGAAATGSGSASGSGGS